MVAAELVVRDWWENCLHFVEQKPGMEVRSEEAVADGTPADRSRAIKDCLAVELLYLLIEAGT